MSIIVNGIELTEVIYAGVNLDTVKVKKGTAEAVTVFEKITQLATPQNVTANGTTVSWDAVENATSYAVLADGSEIGTVFEKQTGYNLSITRGKKTGYSESLAGWINTQIGDIGEYLGGNYKNVSRVICYSAGGGPVQILSYTGQITINGSDAQLNYDYYGYMTIELSSDATFTYVASS